MIKYFIASENDIELLMKSRTEMLRIVNELPDDYEFSEELLVNIREFFLHGNHTTALAVDGRVVIGCATLCYTEMMPTFSHPTGKRAHLMNVYTSSDYRRRGIAMNMLNILFKEAKGRNVTEISLDATDSGRPLYKKMGFTESDECMVLNIGR